MIKQIFEFNEQVIGVSRAEISTLTIPEFEWLKKALNEELQEMADAYAAGDIAGFVDGTLDLVYFAVGALRRMGLTAEQAEACFNAIHNANMTKKKGALAKRGGLAEDAVKPEDFVPPEQFIKQFLGIV